MSHHPPPSPQLRALLWLLWRPLVAKGVRWGPTPAAPRAANTPHLAALLTTPPALRMHFLSLRLSLPPSLSLSFRHLLPPSLPSLGLPGTCCGLTSRCAPAYFAACSYVLLRASTCFYVLLRTSLRASTCFYMLLRASACLIDPYSLTRKVDISGGGSGSGMSQAGMSSVGMSTVGGGMSTGGATHSTLVSESPTFTKVHTY